MAKTKILELAIEQVRIDKSKSARKGKNKHRVIVSLVWPRPRIAERIAIKTLEFNNNTADLSKSGWTEKILFKETISGPFGIQVAITERVSDLQAEKFCRFLGSSLFKLAGSEAKGLMPSSIEGSLVRLPFEYLSKFIADAEGKGPKIAASGTVDLDADKTWEKKDDVRIKVPVKALQSTYKMVGSKRGGGKPVKRQLVVKAGQVSGTVVLSGKLGA